MPKIPSYIYIIFYVFITLIIFIFSGWLSLLRFCIILGIYGLIFFGIHIGWKKLRKKPVLDIPNFSCIFLKKIASGIFLGLVLIGGFGYYQNVFSPARLPLYTLSNQEITLQFQTMSHIASESFYTSVRDNIYTAKSDNYVLYYEGVRPGNEENMSAFNDALGIELEPDTYKNLSTLYGIVAQDNDMFLGLVNDRDYNIDVSIDDIMDKYNQKESSKSSDTPPSPSYNINDEVLGKLSELGEYELLALRFINQAFLNFIMKNDSFRNGVISMLGNEDIFSVILDDRNKHIVEEINTRTDESIFLIYGLMHFQGVFDLLKNSDNRWEIINTESYQAIVPF